MGGSEKTSVLLALRIGETTRGLLPGTGGGRSDLDPAEMVGFRTGKTGGADPLASDMDETSGGELLREPGGEERGVGRAEAGLDARLGSGGFGEMERDIGGGGAARRLANVVSESMAPGDEDRIAEGASSAVRPEVCCAIDEEEFWRDKGFGVAVMGGGSTAAASVDDLLRSEGLPLLNLSRRALTDKPSSSSGSAAAAVGFCIIVSELGLGGMETILGVSCEIERELGIVLGEPTPVVVSVMLLARGVEDRTIGAG